MAGFFRAAANAASAASRQRLAKAGVERLPQARRLRRRGRQVQRRRRAHRPQVTGELVLIGPRRDRRPRVVVDRVVRHARERLARRHHHAQHPLHLPARLVEEIRLAVLVLDVISSWHVPEILRVVPEVLGALVLVLQEPHGDAGVDHVLAVIARVVPAARHVERVAALGLRPAGHALVAGVPGRPRPLGAAGVGHGDLEAAPLVVEEREGVVLELPVHVVADVERQALVLHDHELVALARRLEGREVDELQELPGGLVLAEGSGLAARDGLAGRVEELPVRGLLGLRLPRGDLVAIGQVTDLVHPHLGERPGAALRGDLELGVVQLQIVEADGDRRRAGQLAAEVDHEAPRWARPSRRRASR